MREDIERAKRVNKRYTNWITVLFYQPDKDGKV